MLLQNFADPGIRNTEGKTPLDLADPQAKLVLSGSVGVAVIISLPTYSIGNYRKDELLEAARIGHTEELMTLLTPLNVNCHAADGRKVTIASHDFRCHCYHGYSQHHYTWHVDTIEFRW